MCKKINIVVLITLVILSVSCSSNDVKVVVVQPQGLAGSGIVSWLSFSESGLYSCLGGDNKYTFVI
jgi:hypothetical protein